MTHRLHRTDANHTGNVRLDKFTLARIHYRDILTSLANAVTHGEIAPSEEEFQVILFLCDVFSFTSLWYRFQRLERHAG